MWIRFWCWSNSLFCSSSLVWNPDWVSKLHSALCSLESRSRCRSPPGRCVWSYYCYMILLFWFLYLFALLAFINSAPPSIELRSSIYDGRNYLPPVVIWAFYSWSVIDIFLWFLKTAVFWLVSSFRPLLCSPTYSSKFKVSLALAYWECCALINDAKSNELSSQLWRTGSLPYV